MNKSIFYVGGSKGGVGKSLVSFALADYLLGSGGSVLLLDTDTDNPDVYKAHKGLQLPDLICGLNSLDDADGWSEMLTTVEGNPAHAVVVNSAARSKGGILNHGDLLKDALSELQRGMVTFWVINRHRDSIELLHSFQEVFSDSIIHVCRNLYFGESDRFELYNNSKVRERVERAGMSLDFPALASRVVDNLYSRRMSVLQAARELPFGERVELARWRSRCAEMFARALGGKS
ncbi:MAG: protein mobD [Desulfovibrio sp.]|jgi:hypothetical protein|nr:protein mobD [Desulfovibrio sp.]